MDAIQKSIVLKEGEFDLLQMLEINKNNNYDFSKKINERIESAYNSSKKNRDRFIARVINLPDEPRTIDEWLDKTLASCLIAHHGSKQDFISMIYLNFSFRLSKRYTQYMNILQSKADFEVVSTCYEEAEQLSNILGCLVNKIAIEHLTINTGPAIAEMIVKLESLRDNFNNYFQKHKKGDEQIENTHKAGDKEPKNQRTHNGKMVVHARAKVNQYSASPEFLKFFKDLLKLTDFNFNGSKPVVAKNGTESVQVESLELEASLSFSESIRIFSQETDEKYTLTLRKFLFLKDQIMHWLEDKGISTKGSCEALMTRVKKLPPEIIIALGEMIQTSLDDGVKSKSAKEDVRSSRLDSDHLNIVRALIGSNILAPRPDMGCKIGPYATISLIYAAYHTNITLYNMSHSFEQLCLGINRENIDNQIARFASATQGVYIALLHKILQQKVVSADGTSKRYFAQTCYQEKTNNGKDKEERWMDIEQLNARMEGGNLILYLALHSATQAKLAILFASKDSQVSKIQSDSGPENVKTATKLTNKALEFQEDFREWLIQNNEDKELIKEMNAIEDELDVLQTRDLPLEDVKLIPCASHAMTHLKGLCKILESFVSDTIIIKSKQDFQKHLGSVQLDFIKDLCERLSDLYEANSKLGAKKDDLEARKELASHFDGIIKAIEEMATSSRYKNFFSPVKVQIEYVYDVITRLRDPFLECGLVKLDSNDTERNQKTPVMHYQRSLHSGSFAGAIQTCIIMSLIESAEKRGLNSFKYLSLAYFGSLYILGYIPSDEYFHLLELAHIKLTDEKWIGSKDLPKTYDDLLPTSEFVSSRVQQEEFFEVTSEGIKQLLAKQNEKE